MLYKIDRRTLGDTSITHEDHDLMDRLWVLRQVVPEHGRVIITGQVRGGISLLGVDKVWELQVSVGFMELKIEGGTPLLGLVLMMS